MTDETSITAGTLIGAAKVNGTHVYNVAGDKLGTVEDVMIDKVSGRAIYAVLSVGGFLGLGHKHSPIPWSELKYDDVRGGYVVNLDKKKLQDAPAFDGGPEFTWTPEYGRRLDIYYTAPSYWS